MAAAGALAVLCGQVSAAGPGRDATEFKAWVPTGWKLLSVTRGDLNRDDRPDAVLVLEQDDPALRKPNDRLGPNELNLNPRRLLVLWNNPQGHQLAARSDDLLPPAHDEEDSCRSDPIEEDSIRILRGTLHIRLHDWRSCGGWGASSDETIYRLESGRFRLIGMDHTELMRNSGEMSTSSINFLTLKASSTTGLNVAEDGKGRTLWRRVDAAGPYFLDGPAPQCESPQGRGAVTCR